MCIYLTESVLINSKETFVFLISCLFLLAVIRPQYHLGAIVMVLFIYTAENVLQHGQCMGGNHDTHRFPLRGITCYNLWLTGGALDLQSETKLAC